MSTVLQWLALVACLGGLAWRLPAMLKGRNRSLFWAFLMASISVALSLPAIYVPVDEALGGNNFANVILRLSLFAVFFLLSSRIAAAYNSPLARSLIRGPVGLTVLVACSAGIWVSYFLSDLHGSSAGLAGFFDQPSVVAYMWFGKVYLGYAAACLVLPTGRAAVSSRRLLDRAAALCMCVGFTLVCSTMVVQMTSLHQTAVMSFLSFGSILFVVAGLALVWVSFGRRPTKS
ncbi:MAG: hypothetical protein WBX27_21855 [Specibacter sp.]